MRIILTLAAAAAALAACSDQGQGFRAYEVPGGGTAVRTSTTIQMQGLAPVPRHRVAGAGSAAAAVRVAPLAASPGGSTVSSQSASVWLRVVEFDNAVFLVAEGSGGAITGGPALADEAKIRSGCLVAAGPVAAGGAAVYRLDCS